MNAPSAALVTFSRIARTTAAFTLCSVGTTISLCGPIHDATRKGEQSKVIALLKQNPDLVSSRDKLGNTALHIAALHDQPAIAALLIANGADVNAQNAPQGIDVSRITSISKNAHGDSPLTLALLSYHHKEMVELLLTHGADPNASDQHGTPLQLAIERDHADDIELLLANGADPDITTWGLTTVGCAVVHGKTKILELLLDYGANPNPRDSGGHTPMYYAENGYRSYYGETSSNEKAIAILRAHGGHL